MVTPASQLSEPPPLSLKQIFEGSVFIGSIGYLITRIVTPISPAIGVIAPVTAYLMICIARKVESTKSKALLLVSSFFLPLGIGWVIRVPTSFSASLITITLTFTTSLLLVEGLKKLLEPNSS